jgi:hypothetical protein
MKLYLNIISLNIRLKTIILLEKLSSTQTPISTLEWSGDWKSIREVTGMLKIYICPYFYNWQKAIPMAINMSTKYNSLAINAMAFQRFDSILLILILGNVGDIISSFLLRNWTEISWCLKMICCSSSVWEIPVTGV